jgi:serine/threonine protein kinase
MDEPLSGCLNTSNGLKYFTWKLKHRFESDRFARGKRYDLSPLPTPEQDRLCKYLTRHGDVCNRVGIHPRFPRHLTTVPDPSGQSWWVVDEWTPGRSLAEVLLRGKLERAVLARVMREIAEGLKALHAAGIIRRELSPRFVLLRETDGSVLLTDFELGKLFDGSPTVSADWPGDPYRAPEIGDEPLTEQDQHVDLYSWGRVLVHAASGGLPPMRQEGACLDATGLPPRVREIALRCLAPEAKDRPRTADEVLKAIRYWH